MYGEEYEEYTHNDVRVKRIKCDVFDDVYFFLWTSNFSIFYQLIYEKNQVHTGNLTHSRQTLQLTKFYLIKNMEGNRGN